MWSVRYACMSDGGGTSANPFVGPLPSEAGDKAYHLVQDRDVVEEIERCELPPAEYYEELKKLLPLKFPGADPELVEHVVPLVAAFDVATCFALSFGIAKFQIAQTRVKLVGEYVGRVEDGRPIRRS